MVAEVKKILADSVKNGVPAELIEAGRRHEIVDAEFQRNSVSGLAMEWSEALAVEGHNSPDEDIQAISKATVADVGRVASQYLNPDAAITAVLTPQSSGKPISSSSFGGKESLAPTQTHPVELPDWAAKALARLAVPESSLRPVVTTLPNGLRADCPAGIGEQHGHGDGPNQKQSRRRNGEGQGGRRAAFSANSLSMDPPTSIGWRFRRRSMTLARKSPPGRASPCRFCPPQFDRAVQLLAENELTPALPEDAFKTVQRRLAAQVAGQLKSPDFLTHMALNSALFPKDDPSLRHATPDTVQSLSFAGHQGLLPARFPAGFGHDCGHRKRHAG